MIRRLVDSYSNRFLSRWIVLASDLIAVFVTFLFANLLVKEFDLQKLAFTSIRRQSIVTIVLYGIGFLIAGSYSGIIRHTGQQDGFRLLKGASIALGLVLGLNSISIIMGESAGLIRLSTSMMLIHFLLVLFVLVGSRLFVKALYYRVFNAEMPSKKKVLIYGAGTSGLITKQTMEKEISSSYQVTGFIDDNNYKIGKSLIGAPVYSADKALNEQFLSKNNISQVIIAIQKLDPSKKRDIIERCLELNLETKVIPPVDRWIHGELSAKQIKSVKIEDLLERDPIKLDSSNISRELKGKVILVTGAAGSIGSEIARQVLHYEPEKVILLDQAESPLYELEIELKTNYPDLFEKSESVIGSVADPLRMRKLFTHFRPQVVFHAAAYKHVPLMEDNPYEAVKVNVLGTRILANLAIEFRSEKFVMVSTDKAVNPTNVMGATKRVAELFIQSREGLANLTTQFITTRFGNVLGSNGSVIPVFKRQIETGGPITITDKNITRYFMTIPEACNLVLEAGAMGKGGEVFVFDMGQSVKILDLARKMIQLSGLEEGKDIEIKFVGLRPGEKLYEELLASKENTKETHHKKIMIADVNSGDPKDIELKINEIAMIINRGEGNFELVKKIKNMVPEYKSNNSEYATLDLRKAVNN